MITIFYTMVSDTPAQDRINAILEKLPPVISDKIAQYSSNSDKLARACGKLLLQKQLCHYGLAEKLTLKDMQYNQFNRPFLCSGFDFNIAHSNNMAICAATNSGSIGIDVEAIKNMDITALKDSFTPKEWQNIKNSPQPVVAFYTQWVRKESLLKAIGKGVYQSFPEVEALDNLVSFGNKLYYLQELDIRAGYKVSISTNFPVKDISVVEISFDELVKSS